MELTIDRSDSLKSHHVPLERIRTPHSFGKRIGVRAQNLVTIFGVN